MQSASNSACDVVVVGAGLAGLHAARLLHRAGLHVEVFEARARPGGRVWSQTLACGVRADLGAQWIGPGQHRMHALADEFGLNRVATYAEGDVVVARRGSLRRAASLTPSGWLAKLDVVHLLWRLERHMKRARCARPAPQWIARLLDRQSFAAWLRHNAMTREARDFAGFLVASGMCASAREFSPFELVQQIGTVGSFSALEDAEAEFFVDGAQTIAQRLADGLEGHVRYSAAVRSIEQQGAGVQVRAGEHTCCSSRVVLALPPQLLPAIAFDAATQARIRWRTDALVQGRVVKSVAVFQRAWWRDAGLSGTVAAFDGPFAYLLDGSIGDGEPGILVALSVGPRAGEVAALSLEARKQLLAAHIARHLGANAEPMLECLSADWTSDPWAKGGYASRRGIGGWLRCPAQWAEPLGAIHFAGTETATEWRSYMEGALQSGERAAAEIVRTLGAR